LHAAGIDNNTANCHVLWRN